MSARRTFDALFRPSSVAVVGASPDSWYSSRLMDNLLSYGFEGRVIPVNPGRDRVWGRRCYDALSQVPDPVDLVIVSVPREYAVETVREAGKLDVPAALVITAGFAEADAKGKRLQAELGTVADEYGIAVCGPNSIGLANALENTVITSTCSRAPWAGSIGLISQSGAMAFTTFFERAADEDIHFAYVVSTGNEVDLSLSDYLSWMADRPEVDVICAYLEGMDNPRRFMRVADEATRSGTPVLVVKVGRSELAEAATLSHTGSMTGSDVAWTAAFEQTGVERVPDVGDLLTRASAHSEFDPPASDNACIVSTSGGLASLMADMAAERDLSLPDITGETERQLLDMEDLLTFGEMHNPADIRGYGAEILPEIAEVLFADDTFDVYVFAIGLPAVGEEADDIADCLVTVAEMADQPVLFLWTGRKEPAERGGLLPYERVRAETPLYYDPGRCVDAAASLVAAGENERRESRSRKNLESARGTAPSIDLPSGRALTWQEAEPLLDAYDVPVAETNLATAPDEAIAHAESIGYPVVLKVDSADIPHRTNADAVRVGLDGPDAVHAAYCEIRSNTEEHDPDARIAGVLVQEHLAGGVEAIVGVTQEPGFGPVVTVGPGGTVVELLEDLAVRIPPLSVVEARDAIETTHLEELLAGYRGGPSGDATELARLVRQVGQLATEVETVAELDLNPVIVDDDGVTAVDVLIRTT